MRISFLLGFILFVVSLQGQAVQAVSEDSGVILRDSIWLYSEYDNPQYSDPEFDDSDWDSTVSLMVLTNDSKPSMKGVVWFRKRFKVPEQYRGQIVGMVLSQSGASEIYLDGKLVKQYGVPASDSDQEQLFNPNKLPAPIYLDSNEFHLIAVRFSDTQSFINAQSQEAGATGFHLIIGDFDKTSEEYIDSLLTNTRIRVFLGTFFLTLAIMHLIIFLFYRKKKNNLFYSVFMLCTSSFLFIPEFAMNTNDPEHSKMIISSLRFVIPFFLMAFHGMLYSMFYQRFPKRNWILISLVILLFILLYFKVAIAPLLAVVMSLVVFVDSFRICLVAIIRKKKGAWIVGGGVLFLLLTILGMFLLMLFSSGNNLHIEGDSIAELLLILNIILAILSLPISMTIYLAWDISRTSKELSKQLVQVQDLSEKNLQQEQEKKKILEGQKEKLEIEVQERTKEIRNQKEQLESKNKEIVDSINYAKRIQSAILPPDRMIKSSLPKSFVLYKPKDIVAGDFYWLENLSNESRVPSAASRSSSGVEMPERDLKTSEPFDHSIPLKTSSSQGPNATRHSAPGTILLAAADCTGHGVPGAMVSVVCNNGLNRSVKEFGLSDPGKILDKTRELVIQEFEKSEEDVKDGMDIALVSLSLRSPSDSRGAGSSSELEYAGAHNPLWIIRKGAEEVEEIKANKQPIGKFSHPEPYKTHHVDLNEGDVFYLFSDGFADQFGGPKGKKFKLANFKQLLLTVRDQDMEQQKQSIDKAFEEWRGDNEQLDDVCVIGVRV